MSELNQYSLKKKLLAAAGILAVTAVWGSSFVFMKNALHIVTPLWFLAVRFVIAGTLLALWQGRKLRQLGRKGFLAAVLVGLPLALGYALQTIGLMRTTASNAAVLTGIYIVFVPLLQWLFTRRLGKAQIIIALITFAGLCAFSLDAQARIKTGDIWVVISAVSYAAHFLVLDKYSKIYPSTLLATMQIGVAALLLSLAALVLEPPPAAASFAPVIPTLLYTSVFATAAAFIGQTAAQRILPPTTASVLFTAESLFGAVSGVLLLHENFLPIQILGGLVMFGCMIFSVLGEKLTGKFAHILKRLSSYGKIATAEERSE